MFDNHHMSKKKLLFLFFYMVFLVFFLEICSRGYYFFINKIDFFSSPHDLVYMWYPDLKKINQYEYDKDSYNILFLGGSVLTEGWGNVPNYIKKSGEALGKKINLVNLAASAHGSLDSYYKYKWLEKNRFDFVLFYHGINEVRANNIPPELWEKDYSHYSWYDEVNFYFRHPLLNKTGLLLPHFLNHILFRMNSKKQIPTRSPREEWMEYGKEIKTRESFMENLLKIISIATKKNEPLIIPTFAYALFDLESYLRPDGEKIGYIWIWGKPENVVSGVNAHNTIIRNLARKGDFIFLDQEKLMRGNIQYFKDICHFTDAGSKFFSETILKKIISWNHNN